MSDALTLHTHNFPAMGTPCTFRLYGDNDVWAGTAFAAGLAEIERIEQKYSRYHPDSLLSAINGQGAVSGSIKVDDETADLLDYAFACYAKSGRLFDITAGVLRECWDFSSQRLPDPKMVTTLVARVGLDKLDWRRPTLEFKRAGMEIDLGGIGKEYAADRVAAVFRDLGVQHGLIDLGGDMVAIGPDPCGRPWPIDLRDPRRPGVAAGQVALARGALATSGDYERCMVVEGKRYGHILDPRTGWPVQGMASVTVLADTCMLAGSVATIAMLKGARAPAWLAHTGLGHRWFDLTGRQGGALPSVFDAAPRR